jgi:hypothetical protein
MLNISTGLYYSILTILSSGRKNFENMGRFLYKSGDSIARLLKPAWENFSCAQEISKLLFEGHKKLYIIIDDTMIKKIFSKFMQGAGMQFDTKMGRKIMAFRLMVGMISNGKYSVPIGSSYLFAKELIDLMTESVESKEDAVKRLVILAKSLFPDVEFTVLVDGLYATINFFTWCIENNIRVEARMHSNRVVFFKEEKVRLKDLLNSNNNHKNICPKGRQEGRTISVIWHNLPLEITIVRRVDKHNEETFVFQAATYKALPRVHIANYKKRWPIEMMFRTTKQDLGLEDCQSMKLSIQDNHTSAVFLAYAMAQLEKKTYRLNTSEQAIRSLKTKNAIKLEKSFACKINTFFSNYA